MEENDSHSLGSEDIPQSVRESFERIVRSSGQRLQIPPPVFTAMQGRLVERRKGRLLFQATVKDEEGKELARAKAVHWIVDTEQRRTP